MLTLYPAAVMTEAIIPLIKTEMARLKLLVGAKFRNPGRKLLIMNGNNGARTPTPATKQTTKLINDHCWRIILALRLAVKSAPLKPNVNPIDPNAKIKKNPSRKATIKILIDG